MELQTLITNAETPLRIDGKLLRLFDLLYSTGSVTAAAERLGQSQPTVSIWLAKLRRAFDDPMFVRTPQGMQPTPRATAMIGTAREALACLQRLSARPSDFVPAIAQRHFCVAMTDASHITLLPQLFAHVRAVAPLIRLEAAQICPDTARALQSGEIDLALGLIPELTAGFYEQTLFEQDWVCLANPRHPRLRKSLTVRAYKEEAHVGIVHGTGYRLLEMALARQGVERHILLELPAFLGLSAIISTTDLLATLPRQIGETLARTAGLNVFPCPLSIPSFSVKQHWHTRYHHDAANRWLRAVCVRLFAMKKPRSTRNG